MLRHYVNPYQNDWDEHLAMAEYAINNSYQESIRSTPFRLNYGEDFGAPSIMGYLPNKSSKVPVAEHLAQIIKENLDAAKSALDAAQQRQKRNADRRRLELTFAIGDLVLLNSKNVKFKHEGKRKLLPKWLGPFEIIGHSAEHRRPDKNNGNTYVQPPVSYRLQLPATLKIHNVFHASLLKKYNSDGSVHPPPLPDFAEDEEWFTVERILSHKDVLVTKKCRTKHRPAKKIRERQYLIKWKGYGPEHNSWISEEAVTPSAVQEYWDMLEARQRVAQ
jgi:hypothetical protein